MLNNLLAIRPVLVVLVIDLIEERWLPGVRAAEIECLRLVVDDRICLRIRELLVSG